MDKIEEMIGGYAVLVDEAAQGRAVRVVIIALQRAGGSAVEAGMLDEIERDAVFDGGPKAAVGRIERVVEIEDPRRHMAEFGEQRQAGGGVHEANSASNETTL